MKKAVFAILVFAVLFFSGCGDTQHAVVVEGSEGGNEAEISWENASIPVAKAMLIALDSECTGEGGEITESIFYNENTETWWIELEGIDKEGCNPACVVDEKTETASINWRCTGLIPE